MQADLCLCNAVEGAVEVDGLLGGTEGDFEMGEVALGVRAGGIDMLGVETGTEEEMDTLGVGAGGMDMLGVEKGAGEEMDTLGVRAGGIDMLGVETGAEEEMDALGVGAGGIMLGVETGAEEEIDTLGVGAIEVDGISVVEGAEVTDALGTISV